jgi:hypothetical protein
LGGLGDVGVRVKWRVCDDVRIARLGKFGFAEVISEGDGGCQDTQVQDREIDLKTEQAASKVSSIYFPLSFRYHEGSIRITPI